MAVPLIMFIFKREAHPEFFSGVERGHPEAIYII
jgi:hypothetical protein